MKGRQALGLICAFVVACSSHSASSGIDSTTVVTAPPFPTQVTGFTPEPPASPGADGLDGAQVPVSSTTDGTLVPSFPVTMNDCDTREIEVRWRSIEGTIAVGTVDFLDPGTPPPTRQDVKPKNATAGLMRLSTCEQPAFFLRSGAQNNSLVHVEVEWQAWDAAP